MCHFHVARIFICPDGSLAAGLVLWQNTGAAQSGGSTAACGSHRQGRTVTAVESDISASGAAVGKVR
jgi:hypothetical protein